MEHLLHFCWMQRIPFTITDSGQVFRGTLDVVYGAGTQSDVPTSLHVMIDRYYKGCLFMRRDEWVLPDSKLEKYAGYLGNVVEAWFE